MLRISKVYHELEELSVEFDKMVDEKERIEEEAEVSRAIAEEKLRAALTKNEELMKLSDSLTSALEVCNKTIDHMGDVIVGNKRTIGNLNDMIDDNKRRRLE